MFTIEELHEYSARVRTSFANKLVELPWSEVEKNREASFYSMKNILLHMIDNEEWMANWVIRNKSKDYVRKKSEEYTKLMEEYRNKAIQISFKIDNLKSKGQKNHR